RQQRQRTTESGSQHVLQFKKDALRAYPINKFTKSVVPVMLRSMSSQQHSHSVKSETAADAAADAEFRRRLQALHAQRPLRRPELREARRALAHDRPDIAEQFAAPFLRKHAGDVDALNLMAEILMRRQRKAEAEALLAECVGRAPGFDLARFSYANAL